MFDIILIGGFQESIEAIRENNISLFGYVDAVDQQIGIPYLGTDNDLIASMEIRRNLIIAIDDPLKRMELVTKYQQQGFTIGSFIHKDAKISKSANIGGGVFIQKLTNVSSNVNIAKFTRINTMANIMHDCSIGAYTTIAPNACILGNVKIGQQCYVGANATILPNIHIGNEVIIGAGSVVTKNVEDGSTIYGVPAK